MNAASPWLLFLLEVAGEGRRTTPDDGPSRELRLARGLVELQSRPPGPASARLRLEPVRSGGESGYVGVAGESIVPRVQVAEAGLVAAPFGRVRVVAGLVDDPWVRTAEEAWDLPAVAAALPEGGGPDGPQRSGRRRELGEPRSSPLADRQPALGRGPGPTRVQ